ncbi:MAG: hypothetical protein K6W08_13795, partial [Firmicutes bacterium]|nr:hypothetical protein [Bacillota bacterium]
LLGAGSSVNARKRIVLAAGIGSRSGDTRRLFGAFQAYLITEGGYRVADFLEATYAGDYAGGRWVGPAPYDGAVFDVPLATCINHCAQALLYWARQGRAVTEWHLVGYSLGGLVLLEATLGFLGFSVAPTTPSWGTMLWRAREALHRGDWWLIAFPALFVGAATWAFGTLGETLGRTPPPSFVRAARLRLGREWGHVPAPGLRAARRPAAVRSAASASMGASGGSDGSGAAP